MSYWTLKSKLDIVHGCDGFWLEGNTPSLGSVQVKFKLSCAGPLLDEKIGVYKTREIVQLAPHSRRFGFGYIIGTCMLWAHEKRRGTRNNLTIRGLYR